MVDRKMTAKDYVLARYPKADYRYKTILGRRVYGIFLDISNHTHEPFSDGWTQAQAWRAARKKLEHRQ
jgi:hypothetical protein